MKEGKSDSPGWFTTTAVAIIAVACCAGPILVSALATTGVGGWLATHGYPLAAGAALVLGAVLGWRGLARAWPRGRP